MKNTISEFFWALHIDGTIIQVGTAQDVLWTSGGTQKIQDFVEANQDKNIYFLANVDKECGTKRASDSDIKLKRYFALDLDLAKHGYTKDQIVEFGENLNLMDLPDGYGEFSFVVFTGNGLHIYYIGDPVAISKQDYSDGIKALHKRANEFFLIKPDSACSNIGRILRLPETTNQKNGERVRILYSHQRKSSFVARLRDYANESRGKAEVETMVAAMRTITKDTTVFDKINSIPIQNEVLKDFPNWQFNGKNFKPADGQPAACWVNADNLLIKSDSRWITGQHQGFCTYTYRKTQSGLSDKQTFEYFKNEYAISDKPQSIEIKEVEWIDPIDTIPDNQFTWGTTRLNETMPVIDRHSFIILAGKAGSGKTTFTMDVAIKNAEKGHKVLYLSLEDDTNNIFSRRARAFAGITKVKWVNKDFAPPQLAAYKRKVREFQTMKNLTAFGLHGQIKTTDAIAEFILKRAPDLVIIDNFNLLESENTNKTELDNDKEHSKFFMEFTTNHKIPVIMIHHKNKNAGIRGSQKIIDLSDITLDLTRHDDDKSAIKIITVKDREWDSIEESIAYFKSGTYIDKPIPDATI
jgi:molybdopterin-guanine dinucleotide biosynthesis protein